jgi:hypothetical protein
MPYHPIGLVEVVRELAQQIAELRNEVAQLRRGPASVSEADLVGAAHAVVGSRAFVSAELLAATLRHDAAGLRLAALLRGRSVRSVGKLLEAVCDKAAGGLVLRAVGRERHGRVWCISNAQSHTGEGAAPVQPSKMTASTS